MSSRSRLKDILDRFNKIYNIAGIEEKKISLDEISKKMEDSNLWENAAEASSLSKSNSDLSSEISLFDNIYRDIKDVIALFDLSQEDQGNDSDILLEVEKMTEDIIKRIDDLELQTNFTSPEDKMGCFVEINAGTGGNDSQDLAENVLRMYTMWAQKRGYKVNYLSITYGEECGVKSATIEIIGYLAFGYMKKENGVHRFVRISPFNANGKRQTSFISVFSYPLYEQKSKEIVIDEKDLRIDTYRSSGAGGQHVNTTDSAIRITHIPTKIVAHSQSQRSQVQNKAEAMRLLKAKLVKLEKDNENKTKASIEAGKADISWGNQVRNYIFHPYKLVKDLRSGYETAAVDKVMDGDLDDIMSSLVYIKK